MLTKKEFGAFRKELEQITKGLAEKYNVNIHAGKIKYTDISFNLDVEVTKKEVNGTSFEQAEFEKYCFLYNLKPEHYNKSFKSSGKSYNIIGFKPNRPKFPIIAKSEDGKQYKFTEDILDKIKA